MYRLSPADTEIVCFCQQIMIGRHEVAWLHAREETCESNEERQKLTDRRLELYRQIESDMESLGGYMPEGLYAAHRIMELILEVLAQRLVDRDSWLGGCAIERLAVAVLGAISSAAEAETREKWAAVRVQHKVS
jgi:hypothetical protein